VAVKSVWQLGPTVYLPSLLFGIGQGAVLPVLALTARDLGASIAVAGFVVALMGIGRIAGDVPAGLLAARFGERRAMLGAIAVTVAALFVCLWAPSVWVLGAGVTVLGLAESVWGLARHAYLTDVMPYHLRARALSTLGGMQRAGLFVGPFLAALAMTFWSTPGAYAVHIAVAVLAGAVILVLREPDLGPATPRAGAADAAPVGIATIVRRHLPVLRTLAMGSLLLNAVRAGRPVAIPLWAEHLHLDATATSIIFGISGGLEMLVFYPAGLAMDRWGRQPTVVLSTVGLAVSYVWLPFTGGVTGLLLASALMGLANGMGSGINMTIGADVSPADNRSEFLGTWRLLGDIGAGLGPLLVGAVAAVALAPAVASLGVVAALSAAAMARWLPRYGGPPAPAPAET